MPFDGFEFEAERKPPRRGSNAERLFRLLFVVVAIGMLIMPITATGLIDIVHYVSGR